ncbi:ornithine cyclodeaminase family protein [Kiloniella laminariae]|uniref:Ornithine cyclodeaminase family protein n=1 Tax=Kiloniella laminariae TaxID=454162 RepID=A0ABT4LJX7_9PROT|nr:ornithine cyclodeaminase family protein [Kiloniella laminariae]MCZ4281391.1 ornithine cyclodeaminase family protein [Kiloniella laminariae]
MQNINAQQVTETLDFPSLIEALNTAFKGNITVPQRHHHDMEQPGGQRESTLLLMPAWESGKAVGVKLVTVSPENGKKNLPAIQGIYILFDGETGTPSALIEAKTLTARRTAAASALAASYLARAESQVLTMVGTGVLAPNLIEAHRAVRPIHEVIIWGRDLEKARVLAQEVTASGLTARASDDLEAAVRAADIISCATLSVEPLIKGDWLQPGQHLDLVGAYRPDMREADDIAVQRSSVFVDTRAGATKEGGDIVIPLRNGVLKEEGILADLFDLCRGQHSGRQNDQEITYFKSVGHALEDLAAAQLVDQRLKTE